MKQISINWVHFKKLDDREQAKKALLIAKEQEAGRLAKNHKEFKIEAKRILKESGFIGNKLNDLHISIPSAIGDRLHVFALISGDMLNFYSNQPVKYAVSDFEDWLNDLIERL
jgi:hypothetical protein